MSRAYLDIDIGDAAAYAEATGRFQRAEAWMKAVGAQVRAWFKAMHHKTALCHAHAHRWTRIAALPRSMD